MQGGEMKRALRLMAQMRAARVQPTSAAFHALAMGWRRTRAWKPASASYNEMVLSGTAVDASTHEVFAALFVEAEDKEMTWLVEQGAEMPHARICVCCGETGVGWEQGFPMQRQRGWKGNGRM